MKLRPQICLLLALASFPFCTEAQTRTVTDMLGRNVTMPKTVHRILALHPIPTGLLAILAPQDLVSVDSVFQSRSRSRNSLFTSDVSSRLKTLPVINVYFMHPSAEQIAALHPDVVITMVGDSNIDEEQQLTGIPYFAVSKAPTSSYEASIRLIGQIVGQEKQAGEMADFWKQTVRQVQDRAAKTPNHPTVLYTGKNGDRLSAPGKNTVFSSTLDTAGGQSVSDWLPQALSANESNPVSLEQILAWNPDVIIVSGAAVKEKITTDPLWRPLKAVRAGRVYAPRAYAGLDGLEALLGLVWVQGILLDGDNAAAEAHLTTVMQNYYKLFYGHMLTAAQIAQPAE